MYCELRDFTFNPHRYDAVTGEPSFFDKKGNPIIDDKSGGVEYFLIGNQDFHTIPSQESLKNKKQENEPDTSDLDF